MADSDRSRCPDCRHITDGHDRTGCRWRSCDCTTTARQAAATGGRFLSAREIEVFHLIAQGLTSQEIAQKLFVTEDTAKTFLRTLYRKLGVHSRAHAVALGYQDGYLQPASAVADG